MVSVFKIILFIGVMVLIYIFVPENYIYKFILYLLLFIPVLLFVLDKKHMYKCREENMLSSECISLFKILPQEAYLAYFLMLFFIVVLISVSQ